MKIKRLTALLCGSIMAAAMLSGCGLDKSATAATFDGNNIELGLVNFIARFEQASYDDVYAMYSDQGLGIWSTDMSGSGSTMQQTLVDGVMDNLQEIYTLEKHMSEYNVALTAEEESAISAAASSFIASNSKKAIDALGADQAYVEEYLRLSTIRVKMHEAIIAEVDTEISDGEAKTSSYSYIQLDKTSDAADADTVAEDLANVLVQAQQVASTAAQGTLEKAAEDYEYTVLTGTFTAEDDSLDEAVLTALKGLKEGEVSELVETDSAYYILRLDKEMDEEATEENKKTILEERQDEFYNGKMEEWKEEVTWTVDEKAIGRITFDNLFTTRTESTETEISSEAVEDTTEE